MKLLLSAFLLFLILLSAGCLTTAEEWNQRGETHHTMGRYEEAVAAFDQAIATDPDQSEAWKNRGLSLGRLGRADESEESFAQAISLNPTDSETFYYQALSRNSSGNRPAAMKSLDAAIALPPQNRDQAIILFQSLMMRGDLLTIENRTDEANRSYQMAHEVMMGTI
ncbi:MAG: tetratricopeptide repeat protein [Methanoregulaceae archaeon]|nr:tetratricopeptide repeat protein [Methanoregulaceae archaeon]